MRVTVALLAAVLALAGGAGCGADSAEPGVPKGATVVLDFTPNAVHTGIYAAAARGFYEQEGIELQIRQPGESTDAPKLLAAGRAEFAILDIHDLGIARERGLDLVAVAPIVQRPLASVIARRDAGVRRPGQLENHTVGVTGLPSDLAVLDSEVEADGGDPAEVKTVTIGFNAISALAAGKVDAATGFWNAEGVALRRQGVPVRIFKVDQYGAPPYPELVLTTARETLEQQPELVASVVAATGRGYELVVEDPEAGLDALLAADPALNRAEQTAQLNALLPDLTPAPFNPSVLQAWSSWDVNHGLLESPVEISAAFQLDEE